MYISGTLFYKLGLFDDSVDADVVWEYENS